MLDIYKINRFNALFLIIIYLTDDMTIFISLNRIVKKGLYIDSSYFSKTSIHSYGIYCKL